VIVVKDKDGNKFVINNKDPRFLNGELISTTKGKIVVKDKEGNKFQVNIDDPRFLNGELISIHKNKVVVKDKDGNIFKIDKFDPRYRKELVNVNVGLKPDQSKRISNNIKKRNNEFKKFDKDIKLIYKNNKRQYLIEDFCKHGDLYISIFMLRSLYNLKFKTKIFYCENCLNEFLKDYNPSNEQIINNIQVYNDILNSYPKYSSKFLVQNSLKRFYPDIYKCVLLYAKEFNINEWKEKTYVFKHHIKEIPKCIQSRCNENVFYSKTSKSYSVGCKKHKNCYTSSKGEKELSSFIRQHCNKEYIENDRHLKKEIDILIPSHNIGFEFNGVYFHNSDSKEEYYHYNKWKLCGDNNIQLISIWEDDWLYHNDIVKSMILHKLQLTKNKIYAKKCKINYVDEKQKSEFLNNNHLHLNCCSSINIGLYFNNELVALTCFKNIKDNNYELLRFCSKLNTSVIGGASKLFKYFLNVFNPNYIITYCRCNISDRKIYNILGFKEIEHTKINHWWVKGKIKYNDIDFLDKNKNIDENYLKNKKYFKINGPGLIKYEWVKIN